MYFNAPENYEWYAKRCFLYIRVSTEEQARHGYSLGAQLEELTSFAERFCMKVVDTYTDDGVSARKEVSKRKGLCALLDAVKRNEADYILFIKLDRWFRSVREYYKTQDILDYYNVGWKAILEDYDTTSTNGRLNLNIRLSVAQDESDRTGDRIRFINDSRVKNGGVITGSFPLGLYPENGKVQIDQEKSLIVQAIYDHYDQTHSVRSCIDHAYNVYGIRLGYNRIKRILKNKLYIGHYRGNDNYCPGIIAMDQFERVQNVLVSFSTSRESKHFYIFRGLITCPYCGRRMSAWTQHDYKYGKDYLRYRCAKRYLDNDCENTFTPWEERIEKYLVKNVKEQMRKYLLALKRNALANAPKDETPAIKRKLARLKDLYLDELISLDDYRQDYNNLTARLEKVSNDLKNPAQRKFEIAAFETLMQIDLQETYGNMTPQEKRELWISVVERIEAINKDTFNVVFL